MNFRNKQSNCRIISIFILAYLFVSIGVLISTTIINLTSYKKHNVVEEVRLVPMSSIKTLSIELGDIPIGEPVIAEAKESIKQVELMSEEAPTTVPKNVHTDNKSDFSKQDIILLERVTMSESGNQPFDGKVAVAQTVINRLRSGKYGNTISEVIYSPNQYSTQDNGQPNDEVIKAVQVAINNPPYPSNMLYFRQNYYHKWAVDYKKIGVHYFSLCE